MNDLSAARHVEAGGERPVALAAQYRRLLARLEALAMNANGTDKSWVHQTHDEALHHLEAARLIP